LVKISRALGLTFSAMIEGMRIVSMLVQAQIYSGELGMNTNLKVYHSCGARIVWAPTRLQCFCCVNRTCGVRGYDYPAADWAECGRANFRARITASTYIRSRPRNNPVYIDTKIYLNKYVSPVSAVIKAIMV
jgi:hypothetical protein